MQSIEQSFEEISEFIAKWDITKISVSIVWTYRHIEHTLKVISWINTSLAISNHKEFSQSFNFIRRIAFTFNRIPRGRAKSPKLVTPTWKISQQELQNLLKKVKDEIGSINWYNEKSHFTHGLLWTFDRDQAKKFLAIHTYHHIKIMRDIVYRI